METKADLGKSSFSVMTYYRTKRRQGVISNIFWVHDFTLNSDLVKMKQKIMEKLHNMELHNLWASLNIIRVSAQGGWDGGTCSTIDKRHNLIYFTYTYISVSNATLLSSHFSSALHISAVHGHNLVSSIMTKLLHCMLKFLISCKRDIS